MKDDYKVYSPVSFHTETANEAVINKLLVSGLGPDVTPELVHCYFDSKGLEVISISQPENGKCIVELLNFNGM